MINNSEEKKALAKLSNFYDLRCGQPSQTAAAWKNLFSSSVKIWKENLSWFENSVKGQLNWTTDKVLGDWSSMDVSFEAMSFTFKDKVLLGMDECRRTGESMDVGSWSANWRSTALLAHEPKSKLINFTKSCLAKDKLQRINSWRDAT